jgi:hypothetical protein
VPCCSPLYTQSPESSEGPELPLKALAEGFEVSLAEDGILWVFPRVGQGHEDDAPSEGSKRSSIDASETSEEVPTACPGEALTLSLMPPRRCLLGLSRFLVVVSPKESVDTDPPTEEET